MHQIAINADGGDYVRISLFDRSHPECHDYWDGNWLAASVDVQAGSFHGTVEGDIRADELVGFLEPLRRLQQTLEGTSQFETLENWLSIRATGDGIGHINVECEILDQPGIGNKLLCTLKTDQTHIRNTVAELETAVAAFPVVGHP